MNAIGWIVLILLCWSALSFIIGIVLGKLIKARDERLEMAMRRNGEGLRAKYNHKIAQERMRRAAYLR